MSSAHNQPALVLRPIPRRNHPCDDRRSLRRSFDSASSVLIKRDSIGVIDPRVSGSAHARVDGGPGLPTTVHALGTHFLRLLKSSGSSVKLHMGMSAQLEAGDELHLVGKTSLIATGATSFDPLAYRVESTRPLMLHPMPPNPYCTDGRDSVTVAMVEPSSTIFIGRDVSGVTPALPQDPDVKALRGLTSPFVSKKHVRIRGGPGEPTVCTALTEKPVRLVKRVEGAILLKKDQSSEMEAGDVRPPARPPALPLPPGAAQPLGSRHARLPLCAAPRRSCTSSRRVRGAASTGTASSRPRRFDWCPSTRACSMLDRPPRPRPMDESKCVCHSTTPLSYDWGERSRASGGA